jgi:hypothetical protein
VTSAQALEALRKAEKERKLKEERDYINPAISAEEKAKGNDAFKRGDYPEVRLSLSLFLSLSLSYTSFDFIKLRITYTSPSYFLPPSSLFSRC